MERHVLRFVSMWRMGYYLSKTQEYPVYSQCNTWIIVFDNNGIYVLKTKTVVFIY